MRVRWAHGDEDEEEVRDTRNSRSMDVLMLRVARKGFAQGSVSTQSQSDQYHGALERGAKLTLLY